MRARRGPAGAALAAGLALAGALAGLGAAPLPADASRADAARTAAPASLCIPIFTSCDSPSSSPSPAPSSGSPSPGLPLPGLPATPGTPGAPATGTATPTPAPTPASPDGSAPVFTQPPAQLGSNSLSFTGLKGVTLVTVPLADGSRVPVMKISADSITIQGFSLNVRKKTGPVLLTTADTMTLTGNVQVYLDSATATLPDGTPLTLGASTPPPNNTLPGQLLRATLGLVGATADSIVYTNTKQHLSE